MFEIINNILDGMNIPYYDRQPGFSKNSPSQFITYSFYNVPAFYGCGIEQVTRYHVTFNIYTTGENYKAQADSINDTLTALLLENDFIRQSGNYGISNDFPKYYHKAIEFIYDYEI